MSRSIPLSGVAGLTLLALSGCTYSFTANDAGDAAWVEQVVPALLGRKPINAVETQVLLDILDTHGREAVVDVLMSLPEFDEYWSIVLADAMKVQRTGVAAAPSACFGYSAYPTPASAAPAVADTLSSQASATTSAGLPAFTLADTLRSAIAADDAFAPWRFHAFVLGKATRTGWDGVGRDVFLQGYQRRNATCVDCHNSEYSSAEYAPIPLNMDAGLFPGGYWSAEGARFAFGEKLGAGSGATLFGSANTTCANYLSSMAVDVHGTTGTDFGSMDIAFVGAGCAWDQSGPTCENMDILDLDASLFAGRSAATSSLLGTDLNDAIPTDTYFPGRPTLTGDEAMGVALALSVAEALVEEVEGHGLTLPHGHPRVDEGRAYLQGYAWLLVASDWSLRAPLRSMVLSGTFNMKPPVQASDDYPFPMFFEPWAKDPAADDSFDNRNGQGDLVHRYSVPALLRSVHHALGWNAPAMAPNTYTYPTRDFQRDLGRYESYEEVGFEDVTYQSLLLWEEKVGVCVNPTGGPDWVDYVVTAAQGDPSVTLLDVIVAMKDRFIQESDVDDGLEEAEPWDHYDIELVDDGGGDGGVDWEDVDAVEGWVATEAARADERARQRETERALNAKLEARVAEGEAQMAADGEAWAKQDPEAWVGRYDAYTKWLGDDGWTKTWSAYRDRVRDEGEAHRVLEAYGESAGLWKLALFETEADKLADYFGVASLGVSASTVPDLEALLRGYCGVLTTTPQFLLGGMRRYQAAPDPVPDLLVCLPTQSDYCDEVTLCTAYNARLTAAGYAALTCI